MLLPVRESVKKIFKPSVFLFLLFFVIPSQGFAEELGKYIKINPKHYKDPRCMTAKTPQEKRRARCDEGEVPSILIISNTPKTKKYPDPQYEYDSTLGMYKRRLISRKNY